MRKGYRPYRNRAIMYTLIETGMRRAAITKLNIDHLDPILSEPIDTALECDRFPDYHGSDTELANEAAAVPARCERGHHYGVFIGSLPAGLTERVCFAMHTRIVLLHPAVSPAAKQLPV